MCIAPDVPKAPPPPPPPPAPVNPTADKVHDDPARSAAQDLAAKLGTSQLVIPLLGGVNIPG